jgi:hypothetical protein
MQFSPLKSVNWTQFAIIMGAIIVLWAGLETVIPEPWHDKITLVLLAVSTGVAHLIKASKPEDTTGGSPKP